MITNKKPTGLILGLLIETQTITYRLILGSIFVTQTKARKKASHSHSLNTYKNISFLTNLLGRINHKNHYQGGVL